MEWDTASPRMLKLYITPQEFRLVGINPQNSDANSIKKLKRYLIFLLAQAKLQHNFYADQNNTLLIEIYPDPIGGANVHFILEQQNKGLCKPEIFCFYNSDDLIEASVKLFALHGYRLFKSSLYQYNNLWLMIIRPIDGNKSPAIALLSEYGVLLSGKNETAAMIEEHCKPILKERAADIISFYFS